MKDKKDNLVNAVTITNDEINENVNVNNNEEVFY